VICFFPPNHFSAERRASRLFKQQLQTEFDEVIMFAISFHIDVFKMWTDRRTDWSHVWFNCGMADR
jgi:hypothetical protein